MIITVAIPDKERLSMQEDIDEELCLLEVKYGGKWRYQKYNWRDRDYSGMEISSFVGELNLKEFLDSNGLTLVI